MKLKQIGNKTYYIEHDTNIGVYMTGEDSVCLIDTGSKGDGEKIDEILSERGWHLDFIINTHTHIDHIGGNEYLMKKHGVAAYCTDIDRTFANCPDLEAYYMNGGKPASKLRRIFAHPGEIGFRAIDRSADEDRTTAEGQLGELSWKRLPGHTFGMIGVKTPDDVWFLGDSYLSEAYIERRSFGYLVDAEGYLDTLEMLKSLGGSMFVPSHGIAEENIGNVLDINIENQKHMHEAVRSICGSYKNGAGLDEIISRMYGFAKMKNNAANHALLTSTVKCYLTYLQDSGELECSFEDGVMIWKYNKNAEAL